MNTLFRFLFPHHAAALNQAKQEADGSFSAWLSLQGVLADQNEKIKKLEGEIGELKRENGALREELKEMCDGLDKALYDCIECEDMGCPKCYHCKECQDMGCDCCS